MTELNIKKEIGRRIHDARKEKGLTLKALGELTGNLKQTRLTNWEQGIRAPGPEEIKLLAHALDVSPAFLMCLSDDKVFKQPKRLVQFIPLLDHQQACDAGLHIDAIRTQQPDSLDVIPISTRLLPELSAKAFVLRMIDDSMMPDIRVNDVLVIDPAVSPKPGDFVVATVVGKDEAIVCQYRKLSYTSPEFDLMTLNENWPNINVNKNVQVEIVGKVVQNIRCNL